MKAYIVVQFTPKDKEMLQVYSAKAESTIANFEGEFIAKSEAHVLVGQSDYQYNAIIIFPTQAAAESWFNSPEYQGLTEVREKAMNASFALIS